MENRLSSSTPSIIDSQLDLLTVPDFHLEANSAEDRMTWTNTLKHHIDYIERKMTLLAPTVSTTLFSSSSTSSLPPPLPPASPSPSPSDGLSGKQFPFRRQSLDSDSVVSRVSDSGDEGLSKTRLLTPITKEGRVTPSKRDSLKKSKEGGGGGEVLITRLLENDPEDTLRRPWKRHFLPAEEEIFSGSISKPDSNQRKRLVLVKNNDFEDKNNPQQLPFSIKTSSNHRPQRDPSPSLTVGKQQHRPFSQRLLYIDEKNVLKGQIKWYSQEKPPKVKKIDEKSFEIIDYHVQKAYLFYPKDDCTVHQWIQVLETAF
jgi:hypothetical protein